MRLEAKSSKAAFASFLARRICALRKMEYGSLPFDWLNASSNFLSFNAKKAPIPLRALF